MERVNGIEPSSPGWKPGVIAIIRHPHGKEGTPDYLRASVGA